MSNCTVSPGLHGHRDYPVATRPEEGSKGA
jgi:hypothetical protein